jgi:hypothetical protein
VASIPSLLRLTLSRDALVMLLNHAWNVHYAVVPVAMNAPTGSSRSGCVDFYTGDDRV